MKPFLLITIIASISILGGASPDRCESSESKQVEFESHLGELDYNNPSLYSFMPSPDDANTFRIRFSVTSGSYPNGEIFEKPGDCIGHFFISDTCEVKEKKVSSLSSDGLSTSMVECFEIKTEQ